MTNILHIIRSVRSVAFVTYKEWAAYRSHMFLSLIVGPAFFIAQMLIWESVYKDKTALAGFTLDDILRYYGISTVIYYITMDFADWNLQMLIRTGKFTTYILRPMPHPLFAFSQKIGHRILGFIFEFIPVSLVFLLVFKVNLTPARPFWASISIALSFVILFLINYTVGLLSFWLTRTDGIRALIRLMRDLLAGVYLPLSFFPDSFQKILFFLPFQFANYVPARVFSGSYELGGYHLSIPQIVGIQTLAVLFMLLLTSIVWKFGVKHFTGAGA